MLLRIFLVLGLGLHKLVWEVLKRRGDSPTKPTQKSETTLLTRLVKLFKVAVLAGIVLQTLFLPDFPPITGDPVPLRLFGAIIYVAGLATAIAGRLQLGKNWANLEDYQVMSNQSLVTRGVYGYVRHPIYAGDMLLLLGLELALNSWLFLGIIPLLLVVIRQVKAEERILSQAFPDYGDYCQRTKMFIPHFL